MTEYSSQEHGGFDPRAVAIEAARAADSKKATDIMVQDVASSLAVTDYFVIATAQNPRQVDAIIEEVEDKLREHFDLRPLSRELATDGSWSLLDYGTVVVHVFMPESRDFYRLELLWNDADIIDLAAEEGFENLEYSERIAALLQNAKSASEAAEKSDLDMDV